MIKRPLIVGTVPASYDGKQMSELPHWEPTHCSSHWQNYRYICQQINKDMNEWKNEWMNEFKFVKRIKTYKSKNKACNAWWRSAVSGNTNLNHKIQSISIPCPDIESTAQIGIAVRTDRSGFICVDDWWGVLAHWIACLPRNWRFMGSIPCQGSAEKVFLCLTWVKNPKVTNATYERCRVGERLALCGISAMLTEFPRPREWHWNFRQDSLTIKNCPGIWSSYSSAEIKKPFFGFDLKAISIYLDWQNHQCDRQQCLEK